LKTLEVNVSRRPGIVSKPVLEQVAAAQDQHDIVVFADNLGQPA
jgi:hypothetical protein